MFLRACCQRIRIFLERLCRLVRTGFSWFHTVLSPLWLSLCSRFFLAPLCVRILNAGIYLSRVLASAISSPFPLTLSTWTPLEPSLTHVSMASTAVSLSSPEWSSKAWRNRTGDQESWSQSTTGPVTFVIFRVKDCSPNFAWALQNKWPWLLVVVVGGGGRWENRDKSVWIHFQHWKDNSQCLPCSLQRRHIVLKWNISECSYQYVLC